MTERWRFNQTERENLRAIIGKFILGDSYDRSKSLLEQVQTLRSQEGLLGFGLLGFLAGSSQEKPREEPEWAKMPEDFAGGLEEWQKLPDFEKRAIYEALRAGRKIYISRYVEESKRAMLDSDILMGHKLKSMLRQF